jgi:hypothetical protein
MSRLQQIDEMLAKKPEDAFLRYARALELKSLGREEDSASEFQTLVEKNPTYVPTYLMYGTLLAKLGRTEQARDVLTRGAEAARRAGNSHAAGEIEEALHTL